MKKLMSVFTAISLVFSFALNVFAEEERLCGEYFTKFQLNYDQLREIDRFQTAYYESLYEWDSRPIKRWFNSGENLYTIAEVLGVVGSRGIGAVVSGLVNLIKYGNESSEEQTKDAARRGMLATDRAIDNYISMERSRGDIIFGEVEFFVYDEHRGGERIQMVQGGGDIKRFKTRRGWITTKNPYRKKKEEQMEGLSLNDK